MRYGLAFLLWIAAGVFATANGYVGKVVFERRYGEYASHVYKTVLMIAFIFFMAWIYAVRTQGPEWLSAAIGFAVLWLVLTVLFEFVAGHYLFGNPWERLLADYRIWRGRLWVLVLITEVVAPLTMGYLLNR